MIYDAYCSECLKGCGVAFTEQITMSLCCGNPVISYDEMTAEKKRRERAAKRNTELMETIVDIARGGTNGK